MKIRYRSTKLNANSLKEVEKFNEIVERYEQMGLTLTLRQLYYQLVGKDLIPNTVNSYKRVSKLLTEARMAGLVDWNAIEDRVRKVDIPPSWNSPQSILNSAVNSYAKPRMEGQETYVEVWVEKDALSGVIGQITEPYHVPLMVNRGYSSASAMRNAYLRFKYELSKPCKILYLGDFDPSGLDMIRDIENRLREFSLEDFRYGGFDIEIIPIALNMEQINQYDLPPNPAKKTDSRYQKFEQDNGSDSWELDALDPEVLQEIITDKLLDFIDLDKYQEIVDSEEADKEKIRNLITKL